MPSATDNLATKRPNEFFIAGNKTGLQGRLIEHIAQSLGPIFEHLALSVAMADLQVGQTIHAGLRGLRMERPARGYKEDKKDMTTLLAM